MDATPHSVQPSLLPSNEPTIYSSLVPTTSPQLIALESAEIYLQQLSCTLSEVLISFDDITQPDHIQTLALHARDLIQQLNGAILAAQAAPSTGLLVPSQASQHQAQMEAQITTQLVQNTTISLHMMIQTLKESLQATPV